MVLYNGAFFDSLSRVGMPVLVRPLILTKLLLHKLVRSPKRFSLVYSLLQLHSILLFFVVQMDSILSQYIGKLFSSWTVLRIAEQQGSGGRDTKEKITNLGALVLQNLSKQTEPDDLAELIDDYLCRVLNVICEDDSQYDIASLICQAYSFQQTGKADQIVELIDKIPTACDLSQCSAQAVNSEVVVSDEDSESDSVDSGGGDDFDEMDAD